MSVKISSSTQFDLDSIANSFYVEMYAQIYVGLQHISLGNEKTTQVHFLERPLDLNNTPFNIKLLTVN